MEYERARILLTNLGFPVGLSNRISQMYDGLCRAMPSSNGTDGAEEQSLALAGKSDLILIQAKVVAFLLLKFLTRHFIAGILQKHHEGATQRQYNVALERQVNS